MNKSLIVFYSHSGNTRKIAGLLQEKTRSAIFEIEPVSPYPTAYNAVVEQAKKEIQAGFRPKIKGMPEGIESYDTIFVGSPIWWYTMAPPMATLLAGFDWTGKTIMPFCTHGGGGAGHMEADVEKFCRGAECTSALVISDDGGPRASQQVAAWLPAVVRE